MCKFKQSASIRAPVLGFSCRYFLELSGTHAHTHAGYASALFCEAWTISWFHFVYALNFFVLLAVRKRAPGSKKPGGFASQSHPHRMVLLQYFIIYSFLLWLCYTATNRTAGFSSPPGGIFAALGPSRASALHREKPTGGFFAAEAEAKMSPFWTTMLASLISHTENKIFYRRIVHPDNR